MCPQASYPDDIFKSQSYSLPQSQFIPEPVMSRTTFFFSRLLSRCSDCGLDGAETPTQPASCLCFFLKGMFPDAQPEYLLGHGFHDQAGSHLQSSQRKQQRAHRHFAYVHSVVQGGPKIRFLEVVPSHFKIHTLGPREVAEQLRSLAALPERT